MNLNANKTPLKPDNQNFILAIVLSMAIIFAWQFFFAAPQAEKAAQEQAVVQQQQQAVVPGDPVADNVVMRDAAIKASTRVVIDTPDLSGSINLAGAQFDDLKFKNLRETVSPTSANVTLLSPSGTANAYFAEQGYVATSGSTTKLPDSKSVWTLASGSTLSASTPVTLSWDNGEGLVFKRVISLSDQYVFTVKHEVENKSPAPVSLIPYARVQRQDTPKTEGFYVFFEGLLGVQDGVLTEAGYSDVSDEGGKITKDGKENPRIIAVSTVDKTWATHKDLSDLPRRLLREIEQFFQWILDVEGTEHRLLGWRGVAEAERIINRATLAHTLEVDREVAKRLRAKSAKKKNR